MPQYSDALGESPRVSLVDHDLAQALPDPGGTFANLEHVASPSERAHRAFFEAIGEPPEHEDPSDQLLDVETQLGWLREIGFEDVDCYWKWREMAVLVGIKPERH